MNSLNHLTDDQFAECALQDTGQPIPAAVAEHLAACAQCRAELDAFSAAMQGFTTTATNWSESQPRVSLRALQVARPRLIAHPGMRWAMAAALVGVAALPVVLQGDKSSLTTANAPVPVALSDDSPEEIAEDNRLMERVNLALNASDPSPVDEFGLSPQHSGATRASFEMRSQ